MLILTASDVAQVFDMKAAFAATKQAAIAVSAGTAQSPRRIALHADKPAAEALVMPGVVDDDLLGTKVWFTYGQPRNSVPGTGALIYVHDPELGEEVLVEGGMITDFRTGAIAGLAAEHLAPDDVATLTVLGAGIQARTQILAMLHARPSIEKILVSSRTKSRLDAFIEAMRSEIAQLPHGAIIEAADSPPVAVAAGDIVVAATTSSQPVIQDSWVTKPGAIICGVGSHDRQSTEIDPALVQRANTLVVDTFTGGLDGAADISDPVDHGLVSRDSVIELGDLLQRPRTTAGLTVFKSVGFSSADLISAAVAARAAAKAGLGQRINLHG